MLRVVFLGRLRVIVALEEEPYPYAFCGRLITPGLHTCRTTELGISCASEDADAVSRTSDPFSTIIWKYSYSWVLSNHLNFCYHGKYTRGKDKGNKKKLRLKNKLENKKFV